MDWVSEVPRKIPFGPGLISEDRGVRLCGSATIIAEMGRKGLARGAASQPAWLSHDHPARQPRIRQDACGAGHGAPVLPFFRQERLGEGSNVHPLGTQTEQRLRQMGHCAGMSMPSPAWRRRPASCA